MQGDGREQVPFPESPQGKLCLDWPLSTLRLWHQAKASSGQGRGLGSSLSPALPASGPPGPTQNVITVARGHSLALLILERAPAPSPLASGMDAE